MIRPRSLATHAIVLALGLAVGFGLSVYRYRVATATEGPPLRTARLAVHDGIRAHADVVLLGDSLTDWGPWQELLPDVRLANRGIAGDTIALVRERLGAVDQLTPRTVVLTVGTNDLRMHRPVADVARDHAALVDDLKRRPIRLVVVAVPRGGEQLRDALPYNERVAALNAAIQAVCLQRGIEFNTIDPPGPVAALRAPDGLHLNAAAYQRWAGLLRDWL